MTTVTRIVRAPRGTSLTCKGWPQEAALRMLMNNLDPDVAERPDDLVVYGGSGKAARNWAAFDAIVRSLTSLEHDETLVVQSGKPVGILRTHSGPPRHEVSRRGDRQSRRGARARLYVDGGGDCAIDGAACQRRRRASGAGSARSDARRADGSDGRTRRAARLRAERPLARGSDRAA